MTKKMYVKLDGSGKICEKNSSPKNKADWVEVENFNCNLGDAVANDGSITPKAVDDSAEVWAWALAYYVDNNTSSINDRWLKCVEINSQNTMKPADWTALRAFKAAQ